MSQYTPPTLPRWLTVGVVAVLAAGFAYATIIAQQPLLGLLPVFVAAVGYYAWRVLAALEAIAGAR